MLIAKLDQASLLKKILDAIKELVSDANFECSSTGITLQAMDTSHVSLVHLVLRDEVFSEYRCDRSMTLGINMNSMSKILRCASNEDSLTIKANDNADTVTFVFESTDKDRYSEFELKLINIEADQLGIPETEYQAQVKMPSTEFQRICKDLSLIGDTVTISATKEGVKFSVSGDVGTGGITVRQNSSADDDNATVIDLKEPVTLTFALKYLTQFTKTSGLSTQVILSLNKDHPLLVSYKIHDQGHVRYYLAPKISDDEDEDEDDE